MAHGTLRLKKAKDKTLGSAGIKGIGKHAFVLIGDIREKNFNFQNS